MSSKKLRIGIDIGQNGATAVFLDGKIQEYFLFPKKEDETLDVTAYSNKLMDICSKADTSDIFVVMEDLHSVYGSSAGSNFTFGWNCGATEAVVAVLGIPYKTVQPKVWQKEMWKGVEIVKEISYHKKKKGQPAEPKKNKDGSIKTKTDTKATSLVAAQQLFPGELFRKSERAKTPHDGIVDAVLMGEYANRKF
jgi:hypothetical protein